ncbi:MAG: beta-lactamase family protein [Saprospiraceae bacterium]|nr:beta-lactamase family protein [Saprospiraceae bacterium]
MPKNISILFFCVFTISTVAISAQNSTLAEATDHFFAAQTAPNSPGASVAVLRGKETLLLRGYGLANLEHQIGFTPETISDIGSVAKQITCFAVNLLIERGNIDGPADPISAYLDYIPPELDHIRILDLMHHTSGLREIYALQALQGHRSGDGIRQEDGRALVSRTQTLNFEPGDEYMYCNTAYMLLADLVAAASGASFESWMRENVFQPLEMNDTYVMDVAGEVFPNAAESYLPHEDGYRRLFDNSTAYGQGGIYTSMHDLIKWTLHVMYPEDKKWCLFETINDLRSTSGESLADGTPLTYARGLNISDYHGLRNIGHTGSSAGYRTSVQHFPDHDLTVLIKTNVPSIDRDGYIRLVLETLTDFQSPSKTNSGDEEDDMASFDPGELSAYEGRYVSREYDAGFTLKRILQGSEESDLELTLPFHDPVILTALEEDVFASDLWFLSKLTFKREDGKVMGVNTEGSGLRNIYFDRY